LLCWLIFLKVISLSLSSESSLLVKLLALGLSPLAVVVAVRELVGVLLNYLPAPTGV